MQAVVFDEALLDDLFGAGCKAPVETPAPPLATLPPPLPLPVEEKINISSLQENPKPRVKATWQITRKEKSSPFDFNKHIEAYEKRRQKGERVFKKILSALQGQEKACDYVRLYFSSKNVLWDVEKFKEYTKQNIAYWLEMRERYGDKGIAHYSESIETCNLVLETLEKIKSTKRNAEK